MSIHIHSRRRRTALFASCVVFTASAAMPSVLHAAPSATYQFNLPSEDLADALAAFSRVTSIKVVGASDADVSVPSVQGNLTPATALSAMLTGSGLSYHFTDPDQVVVGAASPAAAGVIGTVRVQAASGTENATPAYGPNVGANGSSDPDATEGTGSYTSNALTIGSKTPLSMRETPQSVSVVTRQQIEDQQLHSITAVLNQAPGITVVQNPTNPLQPEYFSRGYQIDTFQIDGGAPISYVSTNTAGISPNLTPDFDSSEFDSVQIIRGADGLYSGSGDPGGVISLQRKRPVQGVQLNISASIGSYNEHRLVLDGSTPLFGNKKIRLRTIFTHEDHDYFYKYAYAHQNSIYENLELDPFLGTQINIGSDFSDENTLPFLGVLPRYSDGSNINLPRDTCLCSDYTHEGVHSLEYFAELHQSLGSHWNWLVNLSGLQQTSSGVEVQALGFSGINRANGSGDNLSGVRFAAQSTQYSADSSINGKFDIFGHEQSVDFGGNYAYLNTAYPSANAENGYYNNPFNEPPNYGAIDIFTYSPSQVPQPGGYTLNSSNGSEVLKSNSAQYGLYGTLRLSPWAPLHILLGFHYNVYQTRFEQILSFATPPFQRSGTSDHTFVPPYVGATLDLTPRMTAYFSYTGIYNSQSVDRTLSGRQIGPETGTSYELGLKRSDFNGTLNSSISVYHSKQVNLAVLNFAGFSNPVCNAQNGCYLNEGETQTSEGVDVEIDGAITPQLQIAASYTYNENRFDPGASGSGPGVPLTTLAPKHLAKLFATYQFAGAPWLRRLQAGVGIHAQSTTNASGYVCNANFTSCSDEHLNQGGYATFDGFAKYQINPRVSAQLNVTNIFNRKYYQTIGDLGEGSYYGVPLSVLFTLHASL